MAKVKSSNKIAEYVKLFLITTVAAVIICIILLVLTAVLLEKLGLGPNQIRYIVYGIYLITALAAGVIAGKLQKEKKFIWGAMAGGVWFAVVFIASMCLHKEGIDTAELFPAVVCMAGGGMLGGMIS